MSLRAGHVVMIDASPQLKINLPRCLPEQRLGFLAVLSLVSVYLVFNTALSDSELKLHQMSARQRSVFIGSKPRTNIRQLILSSPFGIV